MSFRATSGGSSKHSQTVGSSSTIDNTTSSSACLASGKRTAGSWFACTGSRKATRLGYRWLVPCGFCDTSFSNGAYEPLTCESQGKNQRRDICLMDSAPIRLWGRVQEAPSIGIRVTRRSSWYSEQIEQMIFTSQKDRCRPVLDYSGTPSECYKSNTSRSSQMLSLRLNRWLRLDRASAITSPHPPLAEP